MKALDLNQVAEYLEHATILQTIDGGFALTHYGITSAGNKFFMVNDTEGRTSVLEIPH